MRHHNTNKKFGRVRKVRTGLMRGLVRALVLDERIETTEAKAKALRPRIEKLITKSKSDSVATRRLLAMRMGGQSEVVNKLITDLGPRYKDRNGGYTRITKLGQRNSDAAHMAVIELV